MGIKSELHEAILKRGGKVPPYGGIAAAMDELNKLPSGGNPFYTETETKEILPETIVELDEGQGALPLLDLAEGVTYTVNWNGTEYECVCVVVSMEGVPLYCLGDMSMLGGAGNGEPFAIASAPAEGGTMVMDLTGGGSASVTITGVIETVHGIEGKYLPEGTPYLEEFDDVILAGVTSIGDMGVITDPIGTVKVGNIYNVNWGGVVYPCLARGIVSQEVPYVVLGNAGGFVYGSNVVTAEPFAILTLSAAMAAQLGFTARILSKSYPENNDISIVGGTRVHKISPHCLPDIGETVVVEVVGPDITKVEASKTLDEARSAALSGKNVVLFRIENELDGGIDVYTLASVRSLSLSFFKCFVGDEGTASISYINWELDMDGANAFKQRLTSLTGTT